MARRRELRAGRQSGPDTDAHAVAGHGPATTTSTPTAAAATATAAGRGCQEQGVRRHAAHARRPGR